MHWASDREVGDLRAALAYLRSRPDRDPAGYGLFGVSRGGTTALLVAPAERDVWGVVTDGAFPTIGTMMVYILRWAELYLRNPLIRGMVPRWLYRVLARSGRRNSERRRRCKHNRCREREPEAYAGRLLDFLDRYGPRRPITESPAPPAGPVIASAAVVELPVGFVDQIEAPKLAGEVVTPIR
jgi:hypothetical protein